MGQAGKRLIVLGMVFAAWNGVANADGKRDNDPARVRPVPPLGIALNDDDRRELGSQLAGLKQQIDELRSAESERIRELLPDVEVFYHAVSHAIIHRELFKERDIAVAKSNLRTGRERAYQLSIGKAPWTRQTGLVVRGFVSRLDDTVQPYGLVIPDSYRFDGEKEHRLDIWFHGRGETLSENNFLDQRQKRVGYYAPENTIVLHPYGRYSNAFKFAGEVDVLEALAAAKRNYRIDNERISVRGFSMGGAACWQFAVHYPTRWFAANPGAGFAETPEFLKSFQQQKLTPTWWEQRLWHWYDCPDWSRNLVHCPTVAYSGENDIQKQAADIMAESLAGHGIQLQHVIGPKMGHKIDAASARRIDQKLAQLAAKGRTRVPREIHWTTYTLKYNQAAWLEVTGLREHWRKSTVDAVIEGSRIAIETQGVTGLRLNFPAGTAAASTFDARQGFLPFVVTVDEQAFPLPPLSDHSLSASLFKGTGGQWKLGVPSRETLRKKPGLQGPIDDAFMSRFLFVPPDGQTSLTAASTWAEAEHQRARREWRRQFRGVARSRVISELTPKDIAESNLILWGDPESHSLIKKIAEQLPIRWTQEAIKIGDKSYSADHHALIAIYPNPLNPQKYIVLNSGFTYREFAYLNNARQVPMLPDWAIVDLRTPPDTVWPGKIVAAGFFDENWQLKPID